MIYIFTFICFLKIISQNDITALSGVGFEPTPPFGDQNARAHCVMGRHNILESGALDRSAILTCDTTFSHLRQQNDFHITPYLSVEWI